jgi:carbonic anhydrase|tara:strand:- start:172 stop:813 length:642 start_codon:yes stop_codon:yes gene_type:complete
MVEELVNGFKNFRKSYFEKRSKVLQQLAEKGQSPQTMVICCSDSRVEPSILFGTGPGDLFVVRNVANLVPPFTSKDNVSIGSALEYAVKILRVKDIIVLGHAHCGGVAALCKSISDDKEGEITDNPTDFIKTWVDIAKPALSKMYFDHKDENIEVNSERAVLLYSYNNLLTYPWLNDAVNENSLEIHAWWLDFKSVMLWKKAQGSDSFMPIEF